MRFISLLAAVIMAPWLSGKPRSWSVDVASNDTVEATVIARPRY
jgi:hypothetical protein